MVLKRSGWDKIINTKGVTMTVVTLLAYIREGTIGGILLLEGR